MTTYCYGLQIHRQNFVDGLEYDLSAPDLWIDRNACTDIAVSTGWLRSADNNEWVEAGVTKGSLRNLDGTYSCVTLLSTYYAYNTLVGPNEYNYVEILVPNGRVDPGDNVDIKIQKNDQNQILAYVNTPDRSDEFASARITLQSNNNYYADFGIEGTVSASSEYSSIPMSKYTNTKILRNGVWANLPSTTTINVPVTGQGYLAMKCPSNSFIAGTVTELDCNNIAVRNQIPIFGNIVKIVSTGTPISIPLEAVDTDKDYLSYKLALQPTYGVTGLGNNAPLTTNSDGHTSQVPYDPPNPPVSDSFRVSVTDKRDGHTREALISIVGPTPRPTIPNAVDDLSYTINGNTVTLSWTHPFDGGSEITSYRIERSADTNTWIRVNTIYETLTSYDVASSPGYVQYYRILVNNANGQSGSSNIVQPYITDTTPPVITISTPVTNQVITSQNIPVTSKIFEYDNSGIKNVQMTMDHVITIDPISVSRIGITTATVHSEITGVDNGQRTLTVRATNGDGYIGSKSVSFTKDTPISQNLISFEDDFEGDIAPNWHTTTEDDEYWDIRNPSRTVPNSATDNKVAGTEDCDNKCELIMIHTVDTSTMESPKLSFYRYLSSSLDNGEGLEVSVSTDGGTTFTMLDSFTTDDSKDDNTWHLQEYNLANYASKQFKLKFIAISSSNSEDIEIDTLRIYNAYIPVDTTPPVITVSADITAEATGTLTKIIIPNATATDDSLPIIINHNGTIPMNNGFPLGITAINWTATDSANNTSHTIQNVTIQDTTPPTITINGDAVLDVPFDSSYFDAGVTATDIYDGDLTDDIIVNNPVDTATAGGYQVTYDVTDSNGNAAEQKTRTVTVLPKPDSPPAILPIDDVTINEGATQTVTVDATDPDGDPITYSLIQNPPFFSISGNLITISPEYHHARDYDVTVRAEAGGDFAETSFALKVSDAFPAGDSISAAVDNTSSTLEVTQGEPLLVKFQYSESLPGTGWQCFALTDEDGNRVKSNGDIKLWNDRSQYSYDGINWGGDRYNDKVFYNTCKYLTGDSLWIKIDSRIDADDGNTADEKYYLTISEPSSVMPQFQDVPVELTIRELPPWCKGPVM